MFSEFYCIVPNGHLWHVSPLNEFLCSTSLCLTSFYVRVLNVPAQEHVVASIAILPETIMYECMIASAAMLLANENDNRGGLTSKCHSHVFQKIVTHTPMILSATNSNNLRDACTIIQVGLENLLGCLQSVVATVPLLMPIWPI